MNAAKNLFIYMNVQYPLVTCEHEGNCACVQRSHFDVLTPGNKPNKHTRSQDIQKDGKTRRDSDERFQTLGPGQSFGVVLCAIIIA